MHIDELIEMKKNLEEKVYAIYGDFGNIQLLTTKDEVKQNIDTEGAIRYVEKTLEILTMVYTSLGYSFNDLSILIEFNPILKATFYKDISDHYNPDDSYEETDPFMDYLSGISKDNIKQNMIGNFVRVSLKQRPTRFDENIMDYNNEFYEHNKTLRTSKENDTNMKMLNKTLDKELPGEGIFYVEFDKFIEGLKNLGYNLAFPGEQTSTNIDESIIPMIYGSFCTDESTNVMSINASFKKEQEHVQK